MTVDSGGLCQKKISLGERSLSGSVGTVKRMIIIGMITLAVASTGHELEIA